MSTAQQIIDRACRLIGVVQSGSSATVAETADCLIAMNALLDSWTNDRNMVYSLSDVSKAMVVGDSSYTIVASGDFNTARPVIVKSAYMTIDGTDYPVQVCTDSEWFAIQDKTTTSDLVEKVWYNPTITSSTGTLNVWPVPSAANTLHLVLWTPITAIASAATTITLPNGWERALAYNLAIEIAPEFGASIPQEVARSANASLALIKRRNAPTIKMGNDLAGMFSGNSGYNIEIDQ